MELGEFVRRFAELEKVLNLDGKEWFPDYDINRENNIRGLQEVIDQVPSDIRQDSLAKAFGEDGNPTLYGEDLVFARFCVIWFFGYFRTEEGQKVFSDRMSWDETLRMRAIYFAYTVYWHLGDDFLLRMVIESILRPTMRFELFMDRHKANAPTEQHQQVCLIADEFEMLFRRHYGPKYDAQLQAFSAVGPEPKHEFLPMFGMTETGMTPGYGL